MSNIEASPEGFNMLRRMYGTVQAPLLSPATMGEEGGNDLATNPLQLSWAHKGLHKNIAKLKAQSTLVQHNYGLGLLFHTQHLFQILGTLQQLVHMEGQSVRHQLELYQQQLQMLQNPHIQQMMQGLLSNPQFMSQNPHLQEMMQSPNFLRQISSPESLQV
jgi:ubiquilin